MNKNMGMNIYTTKKEGYRHIGKRFADGIWCWDCKARAERDHLGFFWFCPNCGARASDKTLFNPALRELGFDESKPRKRTGVDGASGFIWCTDEATGLGTNAKKKAMRLGKFRTEYGKLWTSRQFKDMFFDVIEETESDGDFS
jgi:hypothetical protein